jgi:hypothetical protein
VSRSASVHPGSGLLPGDARYTGASAAAPRRKLQQHPSYWSVAKLGGIHIATAFRSDTISAMPLAALNRITGYVEVVSQGGKVIA